MPAAQNKKTPALAEGCAGAGVIWGYIWLPELSRSGRSGPGQARSGPNQVQVRSKSVQVAPSQNRAESTEPNQHNRPPEQTTRTDQQVRNYFKRLSRALRKDFSSAMLPSTRSPLQITYTAGTDEML